MPSRDKVAVITGGARGIGKACAIQLADAGFAVAVVDLLAEAAEQTAGELRSRGGRAVAIEADVTKLSLAESSVARISKEFGRIDVLVNNAGRSMGKGLLEITEEEWTSTIDTNLKSCFCWCRAVAPGMLEQGSGRIINLSSLTAHTGGVTSAVSKFSYAAAKAGVLGLTRALAKELGPKISVNAICPGMIQTELTKNLIAVREVELRAGISLDRIGNPEDIAVLVHFLATAKPLYMTGQDFTVDGGQWMR